MARFLRHGAYGVRL